MLYLSGFQISNIMIFNIKADGSTSVCVCVCVGFSFIQHYEKSLNCKLIIKSISATFLVICEYA